MEQFYYTRCAAGRSVTGKPDYGVRSKSEGIDLESATWLGNKYARYALAAQVPLSEAPKRLAFLHTDRHGPLIVHACVIPVLQGNRDRAFFSHFLTDLGPGASALQAIGYWKSPSWRKQDGDDLSLNLPRIGALEAGPLSEESVAQWLRRPRCAEDAQWALSAYLALEAPQRLYVGGCDEDVANLIFFLARCLPPTLRSGMTFSTHETESSQCECQVMGFWLSNPKMDLPRHCYEKAGFGMNLQIGRRSPTVTIGPFARLALHCLLTSDFAPLQELGAVFDCISGARPRDLDVLTTTKYGTPQFVATRPALRQVLGSPALMRHSLHSPANWDALLAHADRDDLWRVLEERLAAKAEEDKQHYHGELFRQCVHRLYAGGTFPLAEVIKELLPRLTRQPAESWWIQLFTAYRQRCELDKQPIGTSTSDCRTKITVLLAWRELPQLTSAPNEPCLSAIRDAWMRVSLSDVVLVLESSLNDDSKERAVRHAVTTATSLDTVPDAVWAFAAGRPGLTDALLHGPDGRAPLLRSAGSCPSPKCCRVLSTWIGQMNPETVLTKDGLATVERVLDIVQRAPGSSQLERAKSLAILGRFLQGSAQQLDVPAFTKSLREVAGSLNATTQERIVAALLPQLTVDGLTEALSDLARVVPGSPLDFLSMAQRLIRTGAAVGLDEYVMAAMFVLDRVLLRSPEEPGFTEAWNEASWNLRALRQGTLRGFLVRTIICYFPLDGLVLHPAGGLLGALGEQVDDLPRQDERRLEHLRRLANVFGNPDFSRRGLEHLTSVAEAYGAVDGQRSRTLTRGVARKFMSCITGPSDEELEAILSAFLAKLRKPEDEDHFLFLFCQAVNEMQASTPQQRYASSFIRICLDPSGLAQTRRGGWSADHFVPVLRYFWQAMSKPDRNAVKADVRIWGRKFEAAWRAVAPKLEAPR